MRALVCVLRCLWPSVGADMWKLSDVQTLVCRESLFKLYLFRETLCTAVTHEIHSLYFMIFYVNLLHVLFVATASRDLFIFTYLKL